MERVVVVMGTTLTRGNPNGNNPNNNEINITETKQERKKRINREANKRHY